MLTAEEIDLAKEIILVLRPMEVATKELCGQKYVTCSKVIPLINCLIKKTEGFTLLNPIALSLKKAMLENLDIRFDRMEDIGLLTVATILDPRFKTIHLNNPNATARAIKFIKKKIVMILTPPRAKTLVMMIVIGVIVCGQFTLSWLQKKLHHKVLPCLKSAFQQI
ncbi:unnamed protein product [Macrosiphum euphorbiae]|uniref:Uncharacterized protein n=1 Tax=Macrosiphum euphorbiae TaxID=13131 RepID=A0AAV0WIU6_9HEMI|nr:unnamed protein product [Macrosiphum euphorbiae]